MRSIWFGCVLTVGFAARVWAAPPEEDVVAAIKQTRALRDDAEDEGGTCHREMKDALAELTDALKQVREEPRPKALKAARRLADDAISEAKASCSKGYAKRARRELEDIRELLQEGDERPADVPRDDAPSDAARALTTSFLGPNQCLDVTNGGPQNDFVRFQPCGAFTGQRWFLRTAADGWLLFSTQFRGPKRCLDIVNGGALDGYAHLMPCENVSGQHWKTTPWGGAARLTTEWKGEAVCLDVVNGGPNHGMVHLAPCGAYTGQQWFIR